MMALRPTDMEAKENLCSCLLEVAVGLFVL
jgi:hypothetical protein